MKGVHDAPPDAPAAPPPPPPPLLLDGPAPELLHNSTEDALEVWWKQGEARFQQPKTEMMCLLVTPEVYASARAVALTQLWLKAVRDALDEPLYAAHKVSCRPARHSAYARSPTRSLGVAATAAAAAA